jgi:hypothetical protein
VSELLRQALADSGRSEREVAAELGVDPKTVRRWVDGRTPYPRHRSRLSALLRVPEDELWPDLAFNQAMPRTPAPTIVATYPHRWTVPRETWRQLFRSARDEIGILAYAGLFLAEDLGILRTLADQGRSGVTVRILLGDPDSAEVSERGDTEGVGDAMAAKIRNSLVHYRDLIRTNGVEIRLHSTTLYNSVYRADNDVLINPHIYGMAASRAPVLHLRQVEGGDMASTYLDSFESIWRAAKIFE